ncbi:flagellar basal body P-ring formation chaperone FlgA [Aeromonas cavernicola]|uniref:Flagella basal body P-ring formation protein FlgA n=1 Tax=Aeromonas cavernicola TaxID=1006623 RepID=A0A2H9U8E5_9GAMM|nr:flagellar basal body P-ring formation chaperone FlgA [Aeromonas cavernicola]PJG60249.1 flagella basal body P-ring formation protein FlgA [Aeromonas cavernicola]
MSRLFLIVLLFCSSLSCHASEVMSYLQALAQNFVRSQLDIPSDAKVDITVARIDERLSLTRCEHNLSISLPGKMEIRRNTVVYLKCEEENPWDVYLPVRVSIQKPYVTVSEPISKGALLNRAQLTLAYQDQMLIRGDYLTNPDTLVGVRSKRDINPNQPIRMSQICVVCKGDQVTLTAENSRMQIKTTARALQDGSFGETILLVNMRSGKTVQGEVKAAGLVLVLF